jgi:predicted O-methyltransferase YrrM
MFPHVFATEFTTIPPQLQEMVRLPDDEELAHVLNIRQAFAFESEQQFLNSVDLWHFADYARAFRCLKEARCYIEIGTYDKGNLAYVSTIMDDSAIIIDLDIERHEDQAERLLRALKPGQAYHQIVENSLVTQTADLVKQAMKHSNIAAADAIFIDGNHVAEAVLTDYALYSPFVRDGGLILFHDVHWSGCDEYFGTSQAMEIIDKIRPVFVASGRRPIYRFMPILRREAVWGGIGVLVQGRLAL